MAEYTANYNLKKPGINDNALIKDINENMDIVDRELKGRAPLNAQNRVPVANAPLVYKELVRFTASGTFRPSNYPTVDGRYDIILQGGGGSGAYGSTDNKSAGGESGGFLSLHAVPLLSSKSYAVTIGAGGKAVGYDMTGTIGFENGRAGEATSFVGYSVPGGKGGYGGGKPPTPTTANGYTQNLGTEGVGGSGGDSFLAEGGANNYNGIGYDGSLGSGGGAGYRGAYESGKQKSGKGGDGVVIISGWVGGR